MERKEYLALIHGSESPSNRQSVLQVRNFSICSIAMLDPTRARLFAAAESKGDPGRFRLEAGVGIGVCKKVI